MCLTQGPQRSDAGEAGTCGLSVSSQALYHWALPDICNITLLLGWQILNNWGNKYCWLKIYVYCQYSAIPLLAYILCFVLGLFQKKIPRGEEGKRYIFLWVVGADIFQIIWVIGVWKNLITWVVGFYRKSVKDIW